ncbi:dimerization and cyclophilin-binding domain of Mon2 [Microdochium nivale]|nr:dimerization and cyclophilin-binding domain of Mon2 [Microdochium nivale]
MTSQLLATELANLVSESKRKNTDLRQAAEKSLEELKSLRGTTEAQIAAELAQKVNFVHPLIVACGTKNAKFTGIAIVCLLRLIVISALPRSKLNSILEALREATSAGVDAQLKVLQALPTLLQNYSADIKGDLLVTALNICFILQTSKNGIINNTSAATLQQLLVSVFDKVATEDKSSTDEEFVGDAPTRDGGVNLRSAAMDAYRVFRDICLLTENQRAEYIRFSGLPQPFGLELIESVLTSHAAIFASHPEQAHIIRSNVLPLIIAALTGKPRFPVAVRVVRILYKLLKWHLDILGSEGAEALDILAQVLDQDTLLWKRALCMEVFRGIFAEPALLRRIFSLYDAQEGEKKILQKITATFVRVSTEKPQVIGLGNQSTIPAANPYGSDGSSSEQVMLESSGVTGIISGSVGGDPHNVGISSQFSMVRLPCIDQLDKSEAPPVPESYIYALTLSCITSLSEGLAKFILPLTVPGDSRLKKRNLKNDAAGKASPASSDRAATPDVKPTSYIDTPDGTPDRTASLKRNPVPVNPLTLQDHPLIGEIKICADIIESCWPAILATCSTFLFSALDSEFYHGLVRAFQKFAHVAGLLQLSTPRDAFLTTLGKAAVPPNVFSACLNAGATKAALSTPGAESSNSLLNNARGLLSVDTLVNPTGSANERQRQTSVDASAPQTINTRNLLCMRALINLGIALGPRLSKSWSIILETLQQADFVLFITGKSPGKVPVVHSKTPDAKAESEATSLLTNFKAETRSVETAVLRLFESTVDFPNDAFVEVVTAVCSLLQRQTEPTSAASSRPQSPLAPPMLTTALRTPSGQHRKISFASIAPTSTPTQEDQFALTKLGDLAIINVERLLSYPPSVSGWNKMTTELSITLSAVDVAPIIRTRAADIIIRIVLDAAKAANSLGDDSRGKVQLRLLEAVQNALLPLQDEERQTSVAEHLTDVEIHKIILEGLKDLIEDCGETLVQGWEVCFQIIDSVFVQERTGAELHGPLTPQIRLATRSNRLIRPAFSSLQLICSDFLSSLPNPCFLILVDTLYKFCSQEDDLNIALTTVTFFWVLSDFLSNKNESLPISSDLVGNSEAELVKKASLADNGTSDAALWMLLLLRLTAVTADDRIELRNSAIQTLLRILDAYGDKLSPEAWSVCIRSVVFKLFSSIEEELKTVATIESGDKYRQDWHDTAVVILDGISGLLSNYLETLIEHPTFTTYWPELLGHFESMLDFHVLNINTATFKALSQILSQCQSASVKNFNSTSIELAWKLWSRGIPVSDQKNPEKLTDNQKCLLAYVAALLDVHKLMQADITVEQVARMLSLLEEAIQAAMPEAFVSDIDYMTPLQGQILEVLRTLRTDIPGVPSALIKQASSFVSLAYMKPRQHEKSNPNTKRTFIAISKSCMVFLKDLILARTSDLEIYTSGAYVAALEALSLPIVLKYSFPVITKSSQPWQEATTSALAILEATVPKLPVLPIPATALPDVWDMIVVITNSVTNAECEMQTGPNTLARDETFDVESFQRLLALIIPALGGELVPEKTRQMFAENLFQTSIIHPPSHAERDMIYGGDGGGASGLANLYQPRRGQTIDPEPCTRSKMSYVCLDQLFALVQSRDNASSEESYVRLARATAPYTILRSGLILRAYIADQPLRGRMPQPLSQRKELYHILKKLVDLQSEPAAIPDTPNVDSEKRKHLFRLYPLLSKAQVIAARGGDMTAVGLLAEAADAMGDELGLM